MTAVDFFNAARSFKRELTGNPGETLSQADVDALNAATTGRWKPAGAPAGAGGTPGLSGGASGAGGPFPAPAGQITGLSSPDAFFASLREQLGPLDQHQVDGFNVFLPAMGAAGWPIAFAAYGLATPWWETNKTMQPVEEAYWKDDAWRKAHLRYYPWHGRGYVQLTWERNYRRADDELGLGGALTANPRKAMEPAIAARVLVKGMEEGWFTAKSLAMYLPRIGPAQRDAFKEARRIINGTDKAAEIAEIALKMQRALKEGGWA